MPFGFIPESRSPSPGIRREKGGLYSVEPNKIYNMDCLEGMKLIADASIDMILCDLPYGTTACVWDSVIPLKSMWEQYRRIIRPNWGYRAHLQSAVHYYLDRQQHRLVQVLVGVGQDELQRVRKRQETAASLL